MIHADGLGKWQSVLKFSLASAVSRTAIFLVAISRVYTIHTPQYAMTGLKIGAQELVKE
jgi:hypothetical protein